MHWHYFVSMFTRYLLFRIVNHANVIVVTAPSRLFVFGLLHNIISYLISYVCIFRKELHLSKANLRLLCPIILHFKDDVILVTALSTKFFISINTKHYYVLAGMQIWNTKMLLLLTFVI